MMKPYKDAVKLKQVYDQCGSLQATADYFGISKKLVLNHMKKFGIDRNSKTIHIDVEKAKDLLNKGKSQQKVAETLQVSVEVLRARLAEAGYQTNFYHKGFITTWNGYIMIHKPDHPKADARGYIREHRWVMEEHLGRYLESHEHVHHKDENKQNNDISNLEIQVNVDHIAYHSRQSRKECDEALAAEMLKTMTMSDVAMHFNMSESGLRKRLQRTGFYKPLPRGGKRHK